MPSVVWHPEPRTQVLIQLQKAIALCITSTHRWGHCGEGGGLTIASQYKKNVQMQSKMRSGQDLWSGNCKVLMKEIKDQKERRHHAD